MAVGVTLRADAVPALTAYLSDRLGAAVAGSREGRSLAIDLAVAPAAMTPELGQALEAVGPYGQGWPSPRVAVGPVRMLRADLVGRTEPQTHIRFVATGPDGGRVTGIAFRAMETALGQLLLSAGDRPLYLAGEVSVSEWQGRQRAELRLDDAALAS